METKLLLKPSFLAVQRQSKTDKETDEQQGTVYFHYNEMLF